MTKRELRYLARHIPPDATVWVESDGPAYWWEKTHTVYLRCDCVCFPCKTRDSNLTRFAYLAYPRSGHSATVLVAKFSRWLKDIRSERVEQ